MNKLAVLPLIAVVLFAQSEKKKLPFGLPEAQYATPQFRPKFSWPHGLTFLIELRERVRTVPGVQGVAVARARHDNLRGRCGHLLAATLTGAAVPAARAAGLNAAALREE